MAPRDAGRKRLVVKLAKGERVTEFDELPCAIDRQHTSARA
jgi:hypothetical protein